MAELLKNKLDEQLFERFKQLPVFPFFKLISQDKDSLERQKQEFFATGKIPVFNYSKANAFKTEAYLNALSACVSDMQKIEAEDWIRDLYIAKLEELKTRALLVQAIQNRDDALVSKYAHDLFGSSTCSKAELESELAEKLAQAHEFKIHNKPIDAKKFESMVRETLDHYKMANWKIKFYNGTSVKLTRGRTGRTVTVQIPKTFTASVARAKRVLIHEIEVHALRTQNGINSPLHILCLGLDRYLETDEGLAIHFQLQRGKKQNRFDPGFWESYACALSKEMNFKEVFDALLAARQELDKAMGREISEENQKNRVWNLCIRAYRGISNPNKPGLGTCKDHVYRSGLAKIRKLDLNNPELRKQLFAGNLGLHHLDKIQDLDLSYVQTPNLINK